MTITFKGELEIDQNRGVIYFHDKTGITRLRICRLPTPIPDPSGPPSLTKDTLLDITHNHHTNWPKTGGKNE